MNLKTWYLTNTICLITFYKVFLTLKIHVLKIITILYESQKHTVTIYS